MAIYYGLGHPKMKMQLLIKFKHGYKTKKWSEI